MSEIDDQAEVADGIAAGLGREGRLVIVCYDAVSDQLGLAQSREAM
jgi:hypothetical protein